MKLQYLALLTLGGCGATPPLAQAQPTRIEAETKLAAGDLKIIESAEASGGKAVSMPRDWNPLFSGAPPAKGDEFTIWVRYQNKPVLLKSSTQSGQKDLQWLWDSPEKLTWKRAGRWKREEIGDSLIVIRGGDGGEGPILDAIEYSIDDAYDPNKATTKVAKPKSTTAKPTKADDALKKANINDSVAIALGMKDTPDGELFEAEKYASASVTDADSASGGKAVKSDNDWQPLINLTLPKGDAWKVWVRHKGGPFCIKTKSGDRWFWQSPDKFSWTETDVFSRDELKGSLVIGRNDGGAKADSPQIDAIVLKDDTKRDLPADKPDSKKAAQKIAASINWNKIVGQTPAMTWGFNEQQILSVAGSADAAYAEKVRALNPSLVRLHQGDLVASWTDSTKKSWDVEKIKAGFKNADKYLGKARVMLCINTLPSWIAGGDQSKMTIADEDAFAKFCAQLVRIMRVDVKRPIEYWEITNEWDDKFEKTNDLDKLWRIYNKCAAAMRREDAKAKLGGPAFTWPKAMWVQGFLKNCPDVQFMTWHNYATGDIYETNAKIYENVTTNVGGNAQGALDVLKKLGNGRKIETFLTEYNVRYTWDPYERRHQNAVGAVFLASTAKKMAQMGLSGATLWVQKGQSYGSLVNGDNTIRPAYNLFAWAPKYLVGKTAAATTGDENLLEVWPIISVNGARSVLLINKADHALALPSAKMLLPNFTHAEQINCETMLTKIDASGAALSLPGYSLTLLTSAK